MGQRQLDLLAAGSKSSASEPSSGGGADGGGLGRGRSRKSAGGGKKGHGGGEGGGGGGGGGGSGGPTAPTDTSLGTEAQRRYLNYAVSVITARALPDVRDGLKPVQRRILYAMYNNLHLYPDARFRKCATIVGEVLGKYHPHGDASSYDAMVRMAQDFSLRYLLVEGHGNFGSLDGDFAAAYRYTEARLAPLAMELLSEIKQGTVGFRPNYDGTTEEPIVLPAKLPQLLVNGCTGIAVGMATNIPPHNLEEVCQAAIALIDDKDLEVKDLLKYIKGPDFPTGGQITNSKKELREIYETGQGGVRLRGEWKTEASGRSGSGDHIIVTSIPFALSKSTLVERIAEVIIAKKLPMLVDVRDESTADVRIVLELKPGADPALVMSYLYKHTPLELSFHVNMTCLVPTENPEIAGPLRLDLRAILREFLDFREEVVTRRFKFELGELERRIHILEGFAIVFDALDEAIRIIRKSDGKVDAAAKLMKRFDFDDLQTDAILELKLYKLARLEINIILEELKDKRGRAKEIKAILADKRRLWKVIRTELVEVSDKFKDKRRTKIGGAGGEDVEFDAEAFIVDEDVTVILSRDGWLKRVREIKDISATRLREGDAVLTALRGSTKEALAIFSNLGSCYVMRINDVPASTGYGEPIQKLFNFRDGERVVGALLAAAPASKGTLVAAVTKRGFGLRFGLEPHRELSTRAGRRFAKPAEGDEVVGVALAKPDDVVCVVTSEARALLCKADELPELANPGRGVTVIKVGEDDEVVGFGVGRPKEKDVLIAELDSGKKIPIGPGRYHVTGRAGRGHALARKATVAKVSLPEAPPPATLLN
ncbi:MAG TPA: DNA topoisomerase IV subunit A [Polyangia bacterium]|jgi:DNA gyrase subunit A|nr:DNA topoisomerase IV subunit A [Polyangia bacterium]